MTRRLVCTAVHVTAPTPHPPPTAVPIPFTFFWILLHWSLDMINLFLNYYNRISKIVWWFTDIKTPYFIENSAKRVRHVETKPLLWEKKKSIYFEFDRRIMSSFHFWYVFMLFLIKYCCSAFCWSLNLVSILPASKFWKKGFARCSEIFGGAGVVFSFHIKTETSCDINEI